MKKIIILLLSIFTFIGIDNVYAYTADEEGYKEAGNECTDTSRCLLLCNYESDARAVTLYYYANTGEYGVYYKFQNKKYDLGSSANVNSIDRAYIFDTSNDNFSCPIFAYYDISLTKGYEEVCMADSVSKCSAKNNLATKFTDESIMMRTHSIFVDLDKYFEENDLLNVTDEELLNGTFDPNDLNTVVSNMKTNVTTNYLKGIAAPSFVNEYIEKKVNEYSTSAKEELVERKAKLLQKVEEQYKNGEIDEQTYNEYKSNVNNIDPNQYESNYKEGVQQIINWNLGTASEITDCDSLLGNPDTKGTPAYYLVKAFSVMRYAAIILLIVMSILDFVGATTSGDENALKKAIGKVIKRLIACVIIFVLPTLIELFLSYSSDKAISLCGIGE